MSAEVAAPTTPHQPYQCPVCNSRFTRHENLKRHSALHNRLQTEALLPCHICQATFSRSDLRQRHLKRKHPEAVGKADRRRTSQHFERQSSLDGTRRSEITSPTSPSQSHGSLDSRGSNSGSIPELPDGSWSDSSQMVGVPLQAVISNPLSAVGSLLSEFGIETGAAGASPAFGSPEITDDWHPSAQQVEHGCQLFFDHVAHFLPFLHQATFDVGRTPHHLLFAVLSLGHQYGEDISFSQRCFHHARRLVDAEPELVQDSDHALAIVQTNLLLQVFAMFYLDTSGSNYALRRHSAIVSLIRSHGLMQPIPSSAPSIEDLDSLWQEFIRAESRRRTIFAIHQLDTLWYQFLSIPRSLSHLEVKHDLPCPPEYWTASSAGEWAFRQLKTKHAGTTVAYPDAVRLFVSSESDLNTLPAFDAYGAINLTLFLVSSAREISGWCTMTGTLSVERLEPLRSSMLALHPYIRSHTPGTSAAQMALCEAAWESAMMEMQLWSPSHTGGIVQNNIDAMLHHLTTSGPGCDFLCEPSMAEVVQSHVDWFLRYLEATLVPDQEAPWVALHAYKAFTIAWQLLCSGVAGAMHVVGVQDGDLSGALAWARRVFSRRQHWHLGQLIMTNLEHLNTTTG